MTLTGQSLEWRALLLHLKCGTMLAMFRDRDKLWLLPIIAAYLLIATLYATQTPAWQAPDEPAHYNYIHELATTGRFPILRMGDYDQAYLEVLKSHRFPPELSITPVRYEAHQPPLYYQLGAAVFRLTGGDLLPLRLLSVALGAIFIILVYEIVRLIYPGQPALRVGAAAFVAFLPMHVAMSASVNNDALAEVTLAIILLFSIRYVKFATLGPVTPTYFDALVLGLLLGLALITKVSTYVAIPVVVVALGISWYESKRQAANGEWRAVSDKLQAAGDELQAANDKLQATRAPSRTTHYALRITHHVALIIFLALLLALPWYVRNAALYGHLDILGRRQHDAVVVGQLRTAELLAQSGLAAVLERFFVWSFASFWGVFGWMGVWMDSRIYTALLAWSLAVATGCVLLLSTIGRAPSAHSRWSTAARFRGYSLALLAIAALLTTGIYVSYNLIFVQPQGRYLFPALPAIALAVALGWRAVLRPATARTAGVALLVAAVLAAAWTGLSGGINKWSVAIYLTGGVAMLAWWLVLPRLKGSLGPRLSNLAYVAPFAALAGLDLLALYAFILPQLT